jgi:hypothetical protein
MLAGREAVVATGENLVTNLNKEVIRYVSFERSIPLSFWYS